MQSCVMDEAAPDAAARVDTRASASAPPDREATLRLAAEVLDPVLLDAGFQRAAPGHWTGTRFAWHEDVLVDVARRDPGRGPLALAVEIFAGVPRRGIGDPVPGTPLVRALDARAREVLQERVGADGRLVVADAAELRTWLGFVAEHLPAAIARLRGDGSRSLDR